MTDTSHVLKRTVSLSENEMSSESDDDIKMPMPLNMRSPLSKTTDKSTNGKVNEE